MDDPDRGPRRAAAVRQPPPARVDTGTRGRKRGRPPRSLDEITATALELLDQVGIGAFSMRELAVRLKTSTATLYRHVSSREELMAHVVDRLIAGVGAGKGHEPPPRTWHEAARRYALRFHSELAAHPNVLPLIVASVPTGPNALTMREVFITELIRFRFSVDLAARAYTTLVHYVIGFAIQQSTPDAPGPEHAVALRDYYHRLDPARYPSTVAAAEALTTVSVEVEFLEGMQFMLDGIDRALEQRR